MKKLAILLAIMAVMVTGIASAITPTIPTTSAVLRGSVVLNATSTLVEQATNCSVAVSSATSGSSSVTLLLKNDTTNNNAGTEFYINLTYNTGQLVDATDYRFVFTCYNESYETTTSTITGVTIDNTNPICTWSDPTLGSDKYDTTKVWTIIGTNGTSGTLQFGGNAANTLSEASDVFTLNGYATEGAYDIVTATISDGLNTTSCSLNYIRVDKDSTTMQAAVAAAGAAAGAKLADTQQPPQSNNMNIILIGAAAVLVIYFVRKRK